MRKSRIGTAIIGVLILTLTISSCAYRSYGPGYDYGYRPGYGYHYGPPPRVIVRPTPPRQIYRNYGRSRHYNERRSNRNFTAKATGNMAITVAVTEADK
ncbi:hypothetical protein [Dyadobacter sp. NIV53]|uniref:hypothetical protein n=1 Tax=Dyadobacter sp. NIV53 TaxID=2861765 RepID=UPI001C8846E9|nr:hypothetical protein [Dyadobacter sp. NIV53]